MVNPSESWIARRTVRESVYVPLYPLAEWFAANWWRLVYEVESPERSTQLHFRDRHWLASAREGFALPPLLIEPLGETIRLSWQPHKFAHAPIEFVGHGVGYLDLETFSRRVSQFVTRIISRLDEWGVGGTVLHEEWTASQALDAQELDFCRTAARLGLDPFRIEEAVAANIVAAAERLPVEIRDDFFGTVDVVNVSDEAARIAEALHATTAADITVDALRKLHGAFADNAQPDGPPWQMGYAVARRLRSQLGLNAQPLRGLQSVSEALGMREAELRAALPAPHTRFQSVDVVLGYNRRQAPSFVIKHQVPEAEVFGFCRALFDHVTAVTHAPSLVTRARMDRQKRNRAFAAEFLLPADALRQRVTGSLVSEEEVDELARDFFVSWAVVQHQLENHRIARVAGAD